MDGSDITRREIFCVDRLLWCRWCVLAGGREAYDTRRSRKRGRRLQRTNDVPRTAEEPCWTSLVVGVGQSAWLVAISIEGKQCTDKYPQARI